MKRALRILLALAAALALSSCGILYIAWGAAYHARGGYGEPTPHSGK